MRANFMLFGLLLPLAAAAAASPLLTVTENWPPYSTLRDAQIANGAYARVIRTALLRNHLPSEIHVYPWSRSLAQTALRPDTLVFALARTPSRESRFIWVAQLGQDSVYLWHKTGRSQQTIDQIRDCCSICTVQQDASEESIRETGFKTSRLIIASSYADCLRLVHNGSIDYLAQSSPSLQFLLQQQGMATDSLQRGPLLKRYTLYLAASRGTRPKLIHSLRQTLLQMNANGESNKIITSTLQQAGINP
ncbi:substrate-binding periplasmic protein [Vogesella oryzae]|uniref:substrate-binding periplasmic protein n=1 Tax=Vogesella oryzae TaxID=1735285 RepID=UPI001581F36B|nr:transporter substrate-binding domain-containing protein [Vogesella oryzae]